MGWLVMLLLVVALVVSLGAAFLLRRAHRVTASLRTQAAHSLMHLDQRECTIDELRTELDRVKRSLASCRGELGTGT